MSQFTRRSVLGLLGPAALGASALGSGALGSGALGSGALGASSLPVAALPGRHHGAPPTVVTPQAFGAQADGHALDSPAINAAVQACVRTGGGTVYVPPGTYRCGTVELKSNVTLYLEAGATLLGSTAIEDYTANPGGFSNHGDTGSRHLVFARDADNVTLAGPGRIDGQGAAFWKPSGIPPLGPEDAWMDVIARSTAAKGERPSPMLEFVNCRWLRLEDLRLENAPSWTMRPVNCRHVTVQGVCIANPVYGHNTDGIDLDGCSDVLISNCTIETGDDCICFKSENPYGTEPGLTRNIVVTNCILSTCSNGFKIGTGTRGGFENITFSNSVIYNDEVDYKSRVVSGVALEVVDGGWIEGVVVTGIRMQRTRTPLFIRLGNRSRPFQYPQHGLRDIRIENISASGAILASSITGLVTQAVQDVSLRDIRVQNTLPCRPAWVGRSVPERDDAYPEARIYGMLPASGLYVRHVHNLRVDNVEFSATEGEARPAAIFDDVRSVRLAGLSATPIAGGMPMLQAHNAQDLWITGTSAPAGTAALAGLSGEATTGVALSGNDCRNASAVFVRSSEVAASAVVETGNLRGTGTAPSVAGPR